MSAETNSRVTLRVAVAHVFATGRYQPDGRHHLVHVGLLPLQEGAAAEHWIMNPGRPIPGAVAGSAKVFNNSKKEGANAADYPSWPAQRPAIQSRFAEFDALLVMDRAGEPSPEREWLEQAVLAGLERPPVCVSLDELLAFFRPGEVLDDVEELKEKLLLPDKAAVERLGWQASGVQLPALLHAMRRAMRLVLQVVLHRGPEGGSEFPMLGLLRQVLVRAGRRPRALRGFRLLEALASQQPMCCDEALPPDASVKVIASYRLPRPPAKLPAAFDAAELVRAWLAHWSLRSDGVAEPEIGVQDDLTGAQIDEAFAQLRKQAAAAGHTLKPREPQQEYARFVGQALNDGGAYALEAGTGTGKTFGYLVPLLEYLRRRPTAAVVVATSTKSLQDQMQTGELPALLARGADGRRQGRYAAIKTAVLKGKNCYLCAVALEEAFGECFEAAPGQWAPALAWLYLGLRLRDTAGEIESIAQPVERLLGEALSSLRLRVAAEQACRHEPQPDLRVCVFGLHRQRADSANLIITNHYKLLSLPAGLLERAAACVVDEADRFPDNLRGALSRRLQARELLHDVLLPLLGHEHAIAPTPWKGPRRPPRPLFDELRTRLGEITTHLYYHLPPAERPRSGPEEEAYEQLAEAELQDLQGRAAMFEEVAGMLADTPLAADARNTADAAWLAVQAAAAVLRHRRAIWAVREALAAAEAPLVATAEALAIMGGRFQRDRQGRAELPFGLGQAHWQDEQNSALPGQGYQPKNYLSALQAALAEVERPMGEAGYWLGRLATYWPNCCTLAAAAKEASAAELFATRPTDEPTPDEKLTARALRLFERYQGQLGVLSRLLLETPTRDFIPVLERQWPESDVLGWSLTRQPANLWPYLVTVDPEVPSQPLQLRPQETSEAFALRRQAARQRQAALLGDPVLPLYEQFRTVVFTSATLYVQGQLTYLRRMLDQPQPFADTRRIEAVFDYANGERVLAGVPGWLPRYTNGLTHRAGALDGWRDAQCQLLLPLLLAYEGRTLVLFTSNADLEYARNWLAPYLEAHDIELLSQPSRGSSQWCIRRFRRVPHSVLLGVDRMWAGVDFPGHTLCQVVVWRAPMPSLSDPLASHRIRYAGKDAFWQHYGRPAASLKLRQGFGRLVRREKDKGGFVLLDAHLTENFYADLLQELPAECRPLVFASPAELLQQVVGQVLPLLGLKEQLKERGLADINQLLAAAKEGVT